MNKLLLRCALLLSLFAAPLAMSDDHSTVIIADKNGVTAFELATTDDAAPNKTAENPSDSADYDSEVEVEALVSGIVAELKGEWAQLDDSEREEIKAALRSVRDGVSVELDQSMDFKTMIVAVVAIVFTIGSPILIVILLLFFSYRKRKQRTALVEKFIDAGKDVPPEVLSVLSGNRDHTDNLHRGLLLSGVGIGFFLFLGLMVDWDVASIALIPLCVGIARLLIWKLDAKKSLEHDSDSDSAA